MEINIDINKAKNNPDLILLQLKEQIDSIANNSYNNSLNNSIILNTETLLVSNNDDYTSCNELVLKGKILKGDFSLSTFNYEEYLYDNDVVYVLILNKETIIDVIKQIDEINNIKKTYNNSDNSDINGNNNQGVILSIKLKGCFIYKENKDKEITGNRDVNDNNEKVYNIDTEITSTYYNTITNKKLILFLIISKLYSLFFNKYKLQKNKSLYVINNNSTEERIIYKLFNELNYYSNTSNSNNNATKITNTNNIEDINTTNDNINTKIANIPLNHSIDLLLDFTSNSLSNKTKKTIFGMLSYNSIIHTNSKNFQLDPPDLEYLGKMNITISTCCVDNFFDSYSFLGSIVNFINDFFDKTEANKLIIDSDVCIFNSNYRNKNSMNEDNQKNDSAEIKENFLYYSNNSKQISYYNSIKDVLSSGRSRDSNYLIVNL